MAGTVPTAVVPDLFIGFANRIHLAFILSEEQIAILLLFVGFNVTYNMPEDKHMFYNRVVKVFIVCSMIVSLDLSHVAAFIVERC